MFEIEPPRSRELEIEPPWSRELTEYMEERYGIDIDELICEAILECEDEEN